MLTHRFGILWVAAIAVGVSLGIALGQGEQTSQPQRNPSGDTAARPTLHDGFGGFSEAAPTLEALVDSTDLVAAVRFVKQEADYWPETDPQIWVYSRFVVELTEVLSGEAKAGDRIEVFTPGGTQAEWGNPQPGGTFKPEPGDKVVQVSEAGFPPFSPDREEIVFLMKTELQDGTPVWWAVPEGRYEVSNGRVVSIFADVPTDPEQIVQRDAKFDVIGKTPVELRNLVVSHRP